LLASDKGLARRFRGSPWAAASVWSKIEQSGKLGEPIKGPCDFPLNSISKRALSYAAEWPPNRSHSRVADGNKLLSPTSKGMAQQIAVEKSRYHQQSGL
jgi:hypothetical protein